MRSATDAAPPYSLTIADLSGQPDSKDDASIMVTDVSYESYDACSTPALSRKELTLLASHAKLGIYREKKLTPNLALASSRARS